MKPIPSTIFITLLVSTLSTCPTLAATIHVPGDQPSIQHGIDAALDGDLVLVAPGTYFENIDFFGKPITLQSESGADVTVIDGGDCTTGEDNCSVVTFENGETSLSVLDGFTIRNGSGTRIKYGGLWWTAGGGILCDQVSSTIMNCTISENKEGDMGAIYNLESAATITNCTVTDNPVSGISNFASSTTITKCTIARNRSGIYCTERSGADTIIRDCTITENTTPNWGGGIGIWDGAEVTIENCTISRNTAADGGGIVFYYTPAGPGGAAYDSSITNCIITENSAPAGGGIWSMFYNLEIKNCTISNNSAESNGGGLWLRMSDRSQVSN